jgi:hypothetical protein
MAFLGPFSPIIIDKQVHDELWETVKVSFKTYMSWISLAEHKLQADLVGVFIDLKNVCLSYFIGMVHASADFQRVH